jgi:hypothetical protein
MKMNKPMTPALVLEEYDIQGRKIPMQLINEMRERFAQLEIDGVHPWRILIDEVMLENKIKDLETPTERKLSRDRNYITQACAEIMLEKKGYHNHRDDLNWQNRISLFQVPEDYLRLFTCLSIPQQKWRSSNWLSTISKLSINEGGIDINLKTFSRALREIFNSHPNFVAWMDGKEKPDLTFIEIVENWQKPNEAIIYFQALLITEEQWRSSSWMVRKAKLSKSQGGIEKNLSGLNHAINKRFNTRKDFLAWIDGKEKPDLTFKEVVYGWQTPIDALNYFKNLGVPGEQWRSSGWLSNAAKLSINNGGININLEGLYKAIFKKFKSYSIFLAWMDGKQQPDLTFKEIVYGWQTPIDTLAYFKTLGVPREKWRSSSWLQKKARLPLEEGGINISQRSISGFKTTIYKLSSFCGLDGRPHSS